MNKQMINDNEIIQQLKAGRINNYHLLVKKYERLVFSYLIGNHCNSQEVEDIAQESFFKAYKHIASFDLNRKFSSWLLTITRNLMIDYKKKHSSISNKEEEITDFIVSSITSDTLGPEDLTLKKEQNKKIMLLINKLDEELRIPFLLRIVNELSYNEIAENLSLPLQTVKNRIFKARNYLRENRDF